jgi:FkbM family methyltransferase
MSSAATPDVILDFGARRGEGYELFGAQYPDATYIFIEPSPRCKSHIEAVIERYNTYNLLLIHGILGDNAGLTKFFLFENDNDQSGNLYSNRTGTYGATELIDINIVSYDMIPHTIIDFAKINIEGGEYELINSSFFQKIQMFVMEAHNMHVPGKTYKDVIETLKDEYDLHTCGDLSYKYCYIMGTKCKR